MEIIPLSTIVCYQLAVTITLKVWELSVAPWLNWCYLVIQLDDDHYCITIDFSLYVPLPMHNHAVLISSVQKGHCIKMLSCFTKESLP